VANTGAASEADRNIAGFREVQKNLKLGVPGDRQAGARKRDLWTIAGRPHRCVRCAARSIVDTRHNGTSWTENLRVNTLRCHAPSREPGGEVIQKGGRPAHVKIGFARNAQFFEHCDAQSARGIKVNAWSVSRVRPAVRDVAPGIRQLSEQLTCFPGKGMIQAAARRISTIPGAAMRALPATGAWPLPESHPRRRLTAPQEYRPAAG
jgi:hypothetical protein